MYNSALDLQLSSSLSPRKSPFHTLFSPECPTQRWLSWVAQSRDTVFYRAMLRRARLCHVRPSICLSVVTSRFDFHTGWNTSKIIISRLISLRLIAIWAIWSREHPKIRVEGVRSSVQRPAISLRWCNLQDRTKITMTD